MKVRGTCNWDGIMQTTSASLSCCAHHCPHRLSSPGFLLGVRHTLSSFLIGSLLRQFLFAWRCCTDIASIGWSEYVLLTPSLQESDINFSISRIESAWISSRIKARSLSIPRRQSDALFFNFCSAQNFANRNSDGVSSPPLSPGLIISCASDGGGSADRTSWGFASRSTGAASSMTTWNSDAVLAFIISWINFSARLYGSESACSLGLDGGLGSTSFSAQKNSNVHRWPFISNYLDLSFDVSRIIPKVYPSVQDFLSCFSPIIFDLSCFIRANLYYLSGADSVPIPSCIFILFYLCLSRTISVTYPLHRHVADKRDKWQDM